MADGARRSPQGPEAASGLSRAAKTVVVWAKRFCRRLSILLIDAVFLSYLFVMGSYVASRVASGVGAYLPISGGLVVILAIAAAVAWGAFGTSVGIKVVGFLTGRPVPSRARGRRRRFVAADAGDSTRIGRSVPEPSRPQPSKTQAPAKTPWYRTLWGWSIVLCLIVTLAAATVITSVDFSRLVRSFPDAAKILRRLVRPDTTIFAEVVRLTIITVFMGLMSTLLAIPVAVVLSFLGARNLTRGPIGRPVYFVVRALSSIVRSIEPIIWAIVFVIWVRPGPFPGMLALFVCSIADLAKLYSEQLESIDPGPAEAITAVGGRRLQVLVYSIVPQIINPYLSFTLYRCDINVRMGTVIGMVGGGGIGMLLMQYVRVNEWEEVSMCLAAIIAVVWSIDTLSARLRARLS
jgi:phosphonate transport system permease protein